MCGIYLLSVVAEPLPTGAGGGEEPFGEEDALFPPSSLLLPPEWLLRRGPDAWSRCSLRTPSRPGHVSSAASPSSRERRDGHHDPPQHDDDDDDDDAVPDQSKEEEEVTWTAHLYASVLNMRDALVRQPVALPTTSPGRDEDAQDRQYGSDHDDGGDDGADSSSYLAWNGEVYQILLPSSSSTTPCSPDEKHEEGHSAPGPWVNVSGSDLSDTQLVAQLITDHYHHQHQQQQQHHHPGTRRPRRHYQAEPDRAPVDQPGHPRGNPFTPPPPQQEEDDEIDGWLTLLAEKVLPRLVNAEYAFCLLTPRAVYYGRDPWGRRSLLEKADPHPPPGPDDHHRQHSPPTTTMMIQAKEPVWWWSLASVAPPGSANGRDPWREVEPGWVHGHSLVRSSSRPTLPVPPPPPPRRRRILRPVAEPPILSGFPSSSSSSSQEPESMESASQHLEWLLQQAVERRCGGVSSSSSTTISSSSRPPTMVPPLAILFSGGLDSVVLAALVLRVTPRQQQVRLINVSFVDTTTTTTTTTSSSTTTTLGTSMAADTRAALESFRELQALFPERSTSMQLVQRQVDWQEITEQEARIRALIYPKVSTMDLNIATAFWFAAEAAGPDVRILLTGLGADEQMGGYGRHRKAWMQGGEAALRRELDLDMNRLWERNLGRDDRVLSDHGKEARYPFLDVNVVQYLASLPLDQVCDFGLDMGYGDKRILRLIATRLGLRSASTAVKRAIQFGSRIAQVSDKRRFGSRRKATGESFTL